MKTRGERSSIVFHSFNIYGNDNYAMMSTLGNSNSLFKYKSFSIFARGIRNLLFIRHARRTFEYFVEQNRLYTRLFIFRVPFILAEGSYLDN